MRSARSSPGGSATACGARGVILYGLIFWSLATGTSALATGFALLLALRGLVAVGESAYYPTATALIGDWHRPEMRSRALSIHQTAVFAGAGPRRGRHRLYRRPPRAGMHRS